MEINKKAIEERFEGLTVEQLKIELIKANTRIKVLKAESRWLDQLATDYREDNEMEESNESYREYQRIEKDAWKTVEEKYGIER